MALVFKSLVLASALALLPGVASKAGATGNVEGHLTIVGHDEVEPADGKASIPTVQAYTDYPLIILGRNGKEIKRMIADNKGNYRAALPPGEYLLDVKGRARGHIRAKQQSFAVVSNQTVRVDLTIDTGIR